MTGKSRGQRLPQKMSTARYSSRRLFWPLIVLNQLPQLAMVSDARSSNFCLHAQAYDRPTKGILATRCFCGRVSGVPAGRQRSYGINFGKRSLPANRSIFVGLLSSDLSAGYSVPNPCGQQACTGREWHCTRGPEPTSRTVEVIQRHYVVFRRGDNPGSSAPSR